METVPARAKIISGTAPGGVRTRLADALPLDTPFVVQIFPVYACNFKCGYCIFPVPAEKRGFISDRTVMDSGLFARCMEDLTRFPRKVKVLRFVGIGEPLLHRDIADMVRCAVSNDIADVIEILTNGALLTPAMSDALIAAGLTRLVVSLQGTSRKKYRQVCGTDIDFEQFRANLKYFHDHKGSAQMYVKIIDCALDGEDDRQRFYDLFGDRCDTMAIEHAVPIHSGVDYDHLPGVKEQEVTQFGLPVSNVKVCPQPFFTMQINPDGKVVPCYSFEYPGIMGDCNTNSVCDIWNGETFRKFRRKMLEGINGAGEPCETCSIIKYRLFPEDDLKDSVEKLKPFYDPYTGEK
ncbi:radical SAM/SPASM domain-containing protein [Geobacter sp. SVR]|uniref:radical SAM/SPASM domain-containing protein n=1 Tax=Geobacter sp. SVR TaxID=2495594 RepID=UPI00143F0280|nr:radical SAM/SPASM domain-containing protein [Geobacter sp. SVR]BCS55975.1 radical SAM protein [Geobacter sp. SVR]GCF84738.1 radical SAM protein [Geobacter sp. SVR]